MSYIALQLAFLKLMTFIRVIFNNNSHLYLPPIYLFPSFTNCLIPFLLRLFLSSYFMEGLYVQSFPIMFPGKGLILLLFLNDSI